MPCAFGFKIVGKIGLTIQIEKNGAFLTETKLDRQRQNLQPLVTGRKKRLFKTEVKQFFDIRHGNPQGSLSMEETNVKHQEDRNQSAIGAARARQKLLTRRHRLRWNPSNCCQPNLLLTRFLLAGLLFVQ